MTILNKLIFILTPKERKSASFLLLMILVMALIDVIGVASILPFMSVLVNPDLIETNFILIKLFEFFKGFGIENNEQFLFLLGTIVFIILITSLIFKAITTYFQIRFKEMVQYSVSKRLVEKYLHQPYEWFLNNHTAELGKTILSEISNALYKDMAVEIRQFGRFSVKNQKARISRNHSWEVGWMMGRSKSHPEKVGGILRTLGSDR